MKKNLDGYRKQFKGNYSDEPSEKQKNIIEKLRLFYGDDKIPECKTKGEAWNLINKYQEVVKYDRDKNEFYIEDVTITNKTFYRIVTEDEIECMKVVNQLRSVLKGKDLEEYEELISYIGDYNIIKDVSECIIEQQRKAILERMRQRREESRKKYPRKIFPAALEDGYEPGVDPEADADRLLR